MLVAPILKAIPATLYTGHDKAKDKPALVKKVKDMGKKLATKIKPKK